MCARVCAVGICRCVCVPVCAVGICRCVCVLVCVQWVYGYMYLGRYVTRYTSPKVHVSHSRVWAVGML